MTEWITKKKETKWITKKEKPTQWITKKEKPTQWITKKKKPTVDVSYFGDKAMSKYNKYKDSKETQLHSDTEEEGFQKAKSRALNEMSQEEGVTPRFNHGGEAVVQGAGAAIKGTGFKGIF
jgi:hypothetical protein